MTSKQDEKLKQWVEKWTKVAPVMDELRRQQVINSRLADVIAAFDTAFRSALWLAKPRPSSGLVEFQRLLSSKQ